MKQKAFQVDIKSRGPTFSNAIREAQILSKSKAESHTIDMNDVAVHDL